MQDETKNVKIPLETEEDLNENIESIFAGLLSSDCIKGEYNTSKWTGTNILIEDDCKSSLDKIRKNILEDWKENQSTGNDSSPGPEVVKRTHLISLFFKKGCILHTFAFGGAGSFLQINIDE